MSHLAPVKAVRLVRNNRDATEDRGRSTRVPEDMLKCSYRPPDADFYCWRFKVWYNTLDCAFRTKHHTYPGCTRCSQGDFNLRERARDLKLTRYLGGSKP